MSWLEFYLILQCEYCRRISMTDQKSLEELPYLPPKVWSEILSRTNSSICVALGDWVAAKKFLQTQKSKETALENCLNMPDAKELQALGHGVKISKPLSLIAVATSSSRPRLQWLLELGLKDWVHLSPEWQTAMVFSATISSNLDSFLLLLITIPRESLEESEQRLTRCQTIGMLIFVFSLMTPKDAKWFWDSFLDLP